MPLWGWATIAGAALAVAAGWCLIDTGRDIERGAHAIETVKETKDALQTRDRADHDAAGASDHTLIDSVRPDSGR